MTDTDTSSPATMATTFVLVWRLHPRSVTADAAYDTTENMAAIEKADISAYMALVDHEKRTSLFGSDAFTYDAQKDLYTCPKGEL